LKPKKFEETCIRLRYIKDYTNFSLQLKGSVKEPNMFYKYETEKITRKASDAAEYTVFGSSDQHRHAEHI